MIYERKVDAALKHTGLRENLTGTQYMRAALRAYRPGMSFTRELYPELAAAVGSTPSRVERAMRHAIESGFDRCGYDDQVLAMFGNTIDPNKGKPTVSEYIATVARICREGLWE